MARKSKAFRELRPGLPADPPTTVAPAHPGPSGFSIAVNQSQAPTLVPSAPAQDNGRELDWLKDEIDRLRSTVEDLPGDTAEKIEKLSTKVREDIQASEGRVLGAFSSFRQELAAQRLAEAQQREARERAWDRELGAVGTRVDAIQNAHESHLGAHGLNPKGEPDPKAISPMVAPLPALIRSNPKSFLSLALGMGCMVSDLFRGYVLALPQPVLKLLGFDAGHDGGGT